VASRQILTLIGLFASFKPEGATMRTLFVVLGVIISAFFTIGAGAQQSADDASAFVLSVDRQGSYFVAGSNSALALTESSVVEQAAAALRRNAEVTLVVEASEGTPYASVVRAATLLQQAGARKIAFRTRG
jgi:biopolymer transport protein ExbD